MHASAMNNCASFLQTYLQHVPTHGKPRVIEIGAADVNGSLRSLAPPDVDYIGADFVRGKGVDVVVDDPYSLPFEDASADIVLSSSCFEHSELFWLVFLEILRILKPTGLFYLNAPSNGVFHRYPVDCWRFYPDSGRALVTWAKRNQINATLLESYTSNQGDGIFNDYVGIFLKDEKHLGLFPDRVLDFKKDFTNGLRHGEQGFIHPTPQTEDVLKQHLLMNALRQATRTKVS